MARKEDKQPQYLPLIVKAKLHTGGRDYEKIKEELKGQGFTCKQMKGMVREGNYFDGIVLYLSKWNWDNHESWHLYNWDDKDDKEVMLGIYEAEQYHPQAPYRYRDNFEKFQKDWTSGEYDPGMTFTFKDSEVEVLEVLQETNNIRVRQLHQINASSRAIGWAKQKMREGKNNDCISD